MSQRSNVIVHNYSVPTTNSSSSSHAYRYTSSGYSGSSASTMSSQGLSYGGSSLSGGTRPDQSGQYRDRDANGHQGHYAHRSSDHSGNRNVTVWQGNGHQNGAHGEPHPGYQSSSTRARR